MVLEGSATFRGPDGFKASGDGSRQVNIHVNPLFVTQWIEEEDYG